MDAVREIKKDKWNAGFTGMCEYVGFRQSLPE